jgi:hypothetical protein
MEIVVKNTHFTLSFKFSTEERWLLVFGRLKGKKTAVFSTTPPRPVFQYGFLCQMPESRENFCRKRALVLLQPSTFCQRPFVLDRRLYGSAAANRNVCSNGEKAFFSQLEEIFCFRF